jgi:hypothetical protein
MTFRGSSHRGPDSRVDKRSGCGDMRCHPPRLPSPSWVYSSCYWRDHQDARKLCPEDRGEFNGYGPVQVLHRLILCFGLVDPGYRFVLAIRSAFHDIDQALRTSNCIRVPQYRSASVTNLRVIFLVLKLPLSPALSLPTPPFLPSSFPLFSFTSLSQMIQISPTEYSPSYPPSRDSRQGSVKLESSETPGLVVSVPSHQSRSQLGEAHPFGSTDNPTRTGEEAINAIPPTPSIVHSILGNFASVVSLISLIVFVVFFAVTWLTVLQDARLMRDRVHSNATGVSLSLYFNRCALLTVVVTVGINTRP